MPNDIGKSCKVKDNGCLSDYTYPMNDIFILTQHNKQDNM